MMQRLRARLLFLFVLFASTGFAQQKWPNTFLWRISGNGLARPSFLYGTMHLQDKRLFQFSDSLYHSLENVDGFAMEIDFNELMDSLFTRQFRKAEDQFLETEGVKIDKRKIDKSFDSVLKALDIKPDKLTKKDLKKIRDYRMNKLLQQGEMQTIVDGYLYGLALRQGKWVGGIEDVSDQLDLKDELGADLTADEVFLPEVKLRKNLEEMIRIYINRDLQSLADYVDGRYSMEIRDLLLMQRNIKMARRMDSLTNIRTMFFAVGAAHLPGDSGVIRLLQHKGFTVEPVFSSKTISPELYAGKLAAIPWEKIDDDELYSIEMPGTPSDYNLLGQVMKMKIFFDLPTMTLYMAGHTIGGGNSDVIDKAFKEMAERMGANTYKIKTKDISKGDLKGKEGSFDARDGSAKARLLQRKNTVYLLIAFSTKKSNLGTGDVNKFFSSFVPKDLVVHGPKWTKFSIPGKGFSIELPGNPKPNNVINKSAEGTQWTFTTYDMPDNSKGLYYLIQVRDINPGYYLEGDSTYFTAYKNEIAVNFEKILKEEQFIYQGWPAFKIELSFKPGTIYKIFNVIRGNRVYLIAVGGGQNADFSDIEHVFSSLRIENYVPAEWNTFQSGGFRTTAPSRIRKVEKEATGDEETEEVEHFTSYDENEVISYEVLKTPLSPYYWIKDDSSFFEQHFLGYKGYYDSVIQKEFTHNGGLKALDFLIQQPENNTLKKIRLVVNADTLYTLMSFIPKQYINNERVKEFFNDFRIHNELQPSIYSKKSRQLLNALKTKDSIEFGKVRQVFSRVSFDSEDLPLLHRALVENYLTAEETYYTVNDNIVDLLKNIADGSTIQFIAEQYSQLNGEKEELKYKLLEVLANVQTGDSYNLLKNLLLSDLPASGEAGQLGFSLKDSLELTARLYPEIISLSRDSVLREALVDVTNTLLDSNLVSLKDIFPFKKNFLDQAKKNLELAKRAEEHWWMYHGWINFIGKFNDQETNDCLREFLKLDEIDIKYYALIALVKNDQTVNAADLEKLAAKNSYRKDLYEEFIKLNKLNLFPAKYGTQLKIAESEVFQVASDDDEPSSIKFIGEKVADFMGKKQKFYLFRVNFGGEEYSASYLGISGPYSLTGKDIISSSEASGLYWQEEFDTSKIARQFREYLSSIEEYMKEKDQPQVK